MRPQKRKRSEEAAGPSKRIKNKNKWKNIDLSIPTAESRRQTSKALTYADRRRKQLASNMRNFRNRGIDKDDTRPKMDRIRAALEGLSSGRYETISEAASSNGVHYDQIQRRAQGKVKWYRRNGPEPVLSLGEERHLAQWMIKMGKKGLPVTPKQLRDTVQSAIRKEGRVTPFRNGRPSNGWYEAFLQRNPEVKQKLTETLDMAQAKESKEAKEGFSERSESDFEEETDTDTEECSCPICGGIYDESLSVGWVGCDSCDQWFHMLCMPKKLVTDKMLKKKKWYCSFCRQREGMQL